MPIMTANEMSPAVGHSVTVRFESIQVECRVIDVKHVYGKPRILIIPVNGTGQQWIELTRLVIPSVSNSVAVVIPKGE